MTPHPSGKTGKDGERFLYYACTAVVREPKRCGCRVRRLSVRKFENAVIQLLGEIAEDEELLFSLAEESRHHVGDELSVIEGSGQNGNSSGYSAGYFHFNPTSGLRFMDASKQSSSKTAAYLLDIVMSEWPRICWRCTMEPPPLMNAEAYCLRKVCGVTVNGIPAFLAWSLTISPTRVRPSRWGCLRLGKSGPVSGSKQVALTLIQRSISLWT